MGKCIAPIDNFIKETLFLDLGESVKVAVLVSERSFAFCDLSGKRYKELYNVKEPFDLKTHHFVLPRAELEAAGGFFMTVTPYKASKVFESTLDCMTVWVKYDSGKLQNYAETVRKMDRELTLKSSESGNVADGASFEIEHYETKSGDPVVVHAFTFDPGKVKLIAGTPNGTSDYKNQKQTVMGEAEYEKSRGEDVLAAFNADFFDMFGDCAPSGLCVRNGEIIANPESERCFFGMKKNGECVIDSLAGNPLLIGELENAVSGLNLLVDDGELADVSVLEPFGYIAHPRTVAGIKENGETVIMVIDGRRPWHSNGATLVDAAKLLISHGAVRGINLDGGGSSTFIVKNAAGELEMLNHPADLHRPTENLIRDVFDSIILVKRK